MAWETQLLSLGTPVASILNVFQFRMPVKVSILLRHPQPVSLTVVSLKPIMLFFSVNNPLDVPLRIVKSMTTLQDSGCKRQIFVIFSIAQFLITFFLGYILIALRVVI